ncbi:MAG: hypothetical protein WBV82_29740, partial [Myxococcaceae bacterium]
MNAALGVALALILGLPAQALANSQLEEARGLYSSQRFAEALSVLRATRGDPSIPREEKLEVLELLAWCQVAEGLREEAESSFAELLSLEPGWEPPRGTSPKIVDVWKAARARVDVPHDEIAKPRVEPAPEPIPAPEDPKVLAAAPATAVAVAPPAPAPEPAGIFA